MGIRRLGSLATLLTDTATVLLLVVQTAMATTASLAIHAVYANKPLRLRLQRLFVVRAPKE